VITFWLNSVMTEKSLRHINSKMGKKAFDIAMARDYLRELIVEDYSEQR
jgi:hypothetical protein